MLTLSADAVSFFSSLAADVAGFFTEAAFAGSTFFLDFLAPPFFFLLTHLGCLLEAVVCPSARQFYAEINKKDDSSYYLGLLRFFVK